MVASSSPDPNPLAKEEGIIVVAELAGNHPLLLDDPTAVWLVQAGSAHVFAVRLTDAQPAGARHYLFTAEPGEALFGVEPRADVGVGLLAVGGPGTTATRLDAGELCKPSPRADGPGQVGMQLDRWIGRLVQEVIDPGLPPRHARVLPDSGPIELNPGEDVRPAAGVAWVRVDAGRVLFDGLEPLAFPADTGVFPVPATAWVRAVEPTQLAVLTPSELGADDLDAGLQRLHALALKAVSLSLEAAARGDAERLERRAVADRQAVEKGLAGLVLAYEPGQSAARLAAGAQDPLLAAAELVGRALGVDVHAPPRSEASRQQMDSLGAIARASRVRMREVTLDGDWWRHDNGPLLAYRREDNRPMAVLPTSTTRYVLVDPVHGTRQAVDETAARTLSPTAHVFYRPFPHRQLGLVDLLRFGIEGAGRDMAMVAAMGLIGGLLGLASPVATGLLIDQAIPSADRGQLVQLSLALLASAFGLAAFQLTRSIAFQRIEGKLDASIQAGLWDRLLSLPVPFFREYSSGDLTLRTLGMQTIRQVLTGVVVSTVLAAIFSVFSYGLLFFYDWPLALLATGLFVIALGVTALVSVLQLGHLRRASQVGGRMIGLVLELLTGVAKIRVAAAEERAFGVWAQAYGEQAALNRKAQLLAVGLNVWTAAFPLLALTAIFTAMAVGRTESLSTGAFLGFNAAFGQVMAALLAMSGAITIALQVVPLYERARPILETLPEVDVARADPGELTGDVEVNGITFRYPGAGSPALENVSFHAAQGEFVALVGPSGSGKTTLLRMLLGFEAPESGSVHYDGQDLAGLDVRAVRRQMGVVLQSGKLMPGDIYTNIVGSTRLPVDAAWEAARMAGFEEDIRAMPMGMFTMIMEGMGTISGGQRQRLLIARAVVTRPRILLFDEATSALDNETQAAVSRALEGLQATRIVIAHRLSTIMKADRIYVVVEGRVVQSGTYEELMQGGGPFAELARRQLA